MNTRQFASMRAPEHTLSEKILPFLVECDRALAEALRLREENAALTLELRHSRTIQDEAADRIDILTNDLARSNRECSLLRARMKMFGEAATTIVAEAEKESRAPFEPRQRPFVPKYTNHTRAVNVVAAMSQDEETEASRDTSSAHDVLASLHRFSQ